MTEKGLLYQKGVALRAQRRYKEAGECFRAAADAGDPDACWEMHMICSGGGCGLLHYDNVTQREFKQKHYLRLGSTAAGSELCRLELFYCFDGEPLEVFCSETVRALAMLRSDDFRRSDFAKLDPKSQQFDKDAWLNLFYAKLIIKSSQDLCRRYLMHAAEMGLAAAQYSLFKEFGDRSFLKDASLQCFYLASKELLRQKDLCQIATAWEIAHAFFVYSKSFYSDGLSYLLHMNNDIPVIPGSLMKKVQYHLGGFVYQDEVVSDQLDPNDPAQFEPEEYRCLSLYLETRQRARAATLAWIICGKRLRVAHDIRRLIGQLILGKEGIVNFIQD